MPFVFLIALALLFVSLPVVSAQTYSGFNRLIDNVKFTFSGGDNEVRLALEIREKEVVSALENFGNGELDIAVKSLENAQDKLQIVQEKVSLQTAEEVKTSVGEIQEKINQDNLPEEFDRYGLEEEKTGLTAGLTQKTYEYCKELAKGGYEEMLKEEVCNPDTAVPGLEKELADLKDTQTKLFVQLMLEIRSCIDDPGTCNCDEVIDIGEKAKCEKLVATAIKCEYKDDETACNELESMKPAPGDGFARSFVPDFLLNLFSERTDLIEYGLEHSDGVPEECWNENDKPECEKYAALKEEGLDWDEYGNYIGTQRGKIRATHGIGEPSVPTMEESIPQCFDEKGIFLEEKCGKITIVWNEEGLINYIIGTEIDNVIEEFENKSAEHTIDAGVWTVDEGNLEVDGGQNQTQNKGREIKKEMNQINEQIATITYADGTGPGGEGGIVIKGDKQGVVSGDGSGDGGLSTEVKTYTAGDGTDREEDLPEPDLNTINPDLYDSDASTETNIIEEGDGGEGDYAEGTTADGGDAGITGAVVGSGNKESFLGNLLKKIFGI